MQRESEIPEKQGMVGYKQPPQHSQFQPGQSGNPGGQQKGVVYVTEAYKRLGRLSLEELEALDIRKVSVVEAGVINTYKRAASAGQWEAAHAAMKEITDRLEGKATQKKIVENVSIERLEISIVVQLRALARVEGRELSHDDALLELASTREKLEQAQALGYMEAIEAEYVDV